MLAKKIAACPTPHAQKVPPRVSVLLTYKGDKSSLKISESTLKKLQGIEDAEILDAQYIVAKLASNGKITVKQLLSTLADAGIAAETVSPKTSKP